MNVAFFFNCGHPDLNNKAYSYEVFEKIFKSDFRINDGRYMRISHGDILINSKEPPETMQISRSKFHKILFKEFFSATNYDKLKHNEITNTFYKERIYCIFFQNISLEIVEVINISLIRDDSYLGAKDVIYSNIFDYMFIKKGLVEQFMFHERHVDFYYQMGLTREEYRDVSWEELFHDLGYEFDYLEQGARNTIFDEYHTLSHYEKIENFYKAYSIKSKLPQNDIDDFIFYLEEINQSLFDKLYTLMKIVSEAITKEELSSASLAGRRFIESLADSVFEPRKEKFEEMEVKENNYINRIIAYIFIHTKDKKIAYKYKNKIDAILREFHTGVHKEISENKLIENLDSLVLLLLEIIRISPYAIRNPYIAYKDRLSGFLGKNN